ncbi:MULTISPECIES: DnaD domain-containing protein [unclassified Virgibacillus]|uniref:DnaD domain-containing protein n=1 Tax=unclassified Virgibacillus TaxID=2620237 RepID=UPI0024DE59B8|nr:DnaD domain-containing protein [Virgibacillus sp. LDC-1]
MIKSVTMQQILLNQLPIPANLLTSYTKIGLDEKEVMIILQIHRFSFEGNFFPTPGDLASCLTIDEGDCSKILRKLIQKNYLSIEQVENDQAQLTEIYSLNPLWEQLYTKTKAETEEVHQDGTIFVLFEQEFGRPLSPFEIEMINAWLDEDKIEPALIKAALRESVLMGKLNFKYMDRILREWQRKGIKTVDEARAASKSFHTNKKQAIQPEPKKRDTSFYYNWLEGEE